MKSTNKRRLTARNLAVMVGFLIGLSPALASLQPPIPSLPAENDVMFLPDSPPPNPESRDFISVHEQEGAARDFNNAWQPTRDVTISGHTLVIQEGHLNDLYRYHGRSNIAHFTLFADTVIINSPLHLPSAQITIHARSVKAGPDGALITTPPTRPEQGNNGEGYGLPGLNGYAAGNVKIVAQEADPVRINLIGGTGGMGGSGSKGNDGQIMQIADTMHGRWWEIPEWIRANTTYVETRRRVCEWFNCWHVHGYYGNSSPPTPATDAKAPGKAGSGGNGGNLYISQNLYTESIGNQADLSAGGNANPRPRQPGGNAPWPNPYFHLFKDVDDSVRITLGPIWVVGGNNADPLPADGGQQAGALIVTDDIPGDWIKANALRSVLRYAKETYLNSRNAVVTRQILGDYIKAIEDYQKTPRWVCADPNPDACSGILLPPIERAEINEILTEMSDLVYRIDNNLDYFGNPPGWVPLLSFEAWKGFYEQEINRAMNVLYLDYWVQADGRQLAKKKEGLSHLRQQLLGDIDFIRAEIPKKQAIIDTELRIKANQIEADIPGLMNDLQTLENQIRANAEAQKKGEVAKANLIRNVRIVGTVLKAIPIPICTGIGMGLDAVAGIAESADPKDPWGTLQQLPSVKEAFDTGYGSPEVAEKRKDWDMAIGNAKTAAENLQFSDPNSIAKQVPIIHQSIGQANNLIRPISELSALNKPIKVKSEEVDAMVAKMQADNPQYRSLMQKIRLKIQEKQALVDQLHKTAREINELQSRGEKNILAVNRLNTELQHVTQNLSLETLEYLKDIAEAARERLLRYQYYLAKAYQYRMLQTYPSNVNLENLMTKIIGMAEAVNAPGTLSEGEFGSLRGIYDATLSAITDKILSTVELPKYKDKTTFSLNPDQLKQLNETGALTLNLMKPGQAWEGFFSFEENIRIYDIDIKAKTNSLAAFRLALEHSGISMLEKDGKVYQFNHRSESGNTNRAAYSWQITYRGGIGSKVERSPEEKSLLWSLLGDAANNDNVMLFSLPGAWSDFRVSVNSGIDGFNPEISELVLEISYTMQQRTTDKSVLKLSSRDGQVNRITPVFSIDTADLNERGDGIDLFNRAYAPGSAVTVEAPINQGHFKFDSWRNSMGTIVSLDSRMTTVMSSSSKSLVAHYVDNPLFDYDEDGMPDEWERRYGFNAIDFTDGDQDADGDGVSNKDEYFKGTDPRVKDQVVLPDAPTSVIAIAGNSEASVTWKEPAKSGSSAIIHYNVTSTPEDKNCVATAPASTCTVENLTNGVPYTFTVTATNGQGTGPASAPSNSVIPTVPPIKPPHRDFNIDGKGDLIWRHATTGQNRLWLMNGLLAPVAKAVTTVADGQWKIVASDDFDGDGKADLFWRHRTSGKNQVWLMDGNQVLLEKDLMTVADLNWQVMGTGDLNNDGKRDIIWRNVVTGGNRAWFMNGTEAPAVKSIAAQANIQWELVQIADFNGDGKADLFWRQKTTGANALWLMNGNLVTTKKALLKLADANWQVVGSGDFNQDGVFDVMWRHATTGANRLWLMNTKASPTVKTVTALAGAAWKITQVNDFDGDGKADLFWCNMTTGATSLWRMNGSQVLAKKALTREADLKWEVVR